MTYITCSPTTFLTPHHHPETPNPPRAPPTPRSHRVLSGLLPEHLWDSCSQNAHSPGLGSLHFVPRLLKQPNRPLSFCLPTHHSSYVSLYLSCLIRINVPSLPTLSPTFLAGLTNCAGRSQPPSPAPSLSQLTFKLPSYPAAEPLAMLLCHAAPPAWGPHASTIVSWLKSQLPFLTSTKHRLYHEASLNFPWVATTFSFEPSLTT